MSRLEPSDLAYLLCAAANYANAQQDRHDCEILLTVQPDGLQATARTYSFAATWFTPWAALRHATTLTPVIDTVVRELEKTHAEYPDAPRNLAEVCDAD